MWLQTNRGFLSIVAKDAAGKPSGKSPDSIVSVRFRRVEDAAKHFPDLPVVKTPRGDYCCRVFATRQQVATMLVSEVSGLDYDNFKSSIPKADRALYSACNAAWSVFGRLQPGGPYGDWHHNYRQPQLPMNHAGTWSFDEGMVLDDTAYDTPDSYADEDEDDLAWAVADEVLDNLTTLSSDHPGETATWLIEECARRMEKSEEVVRSALALMEIDPNNVSDWN